MNNRYHQLLLRWNLAPATAAMWQLATNQTCQPLGIQARWLDLGKPWNQISKADDQNGWELEESIATCPPAALVIGIERGNFSNILGGIPDLRELCKRWPADAEYLSETSIRSTFLIGWFPQADHDAILLLRELGIDLVLHNPATLRPALEKIARYGHCSDRKGDRSSY